jgi:molybdopterin converting factor small subunit
MHVYVEFLGLSRLVAGVREKTFDLPEGTTFRDIVRRLKSEYPAMVGNVIQPDGETLQAPNIFNLNGRRMIQQGQMDDVLGDGDRVVLMSMSAGG